MILSRERGVPGVHLRRLLDVEPRWAAGFVVAVHHPVVWREGIMIIGDHFQLVADGRFASAMQCEKLTPPFPAAGAQACVPSRLQGRRMVRNGSSDVTCPGDAIHVGTNA